MPHSAATSRRMTSLGGLNASLIQDERSHTAPHSASRPVFSWLDREVPDVPPGREPSLLDAVCPCRPASLAQKVLCGEVIVAVEEDLTHSWTLLRLEGGGCVGLTMVDPDVRLTRLPLQPPVLSPLVGQRIRELRFRRRLADGCAPELPEITTTARHLFLFLYAAKKGGVCGLNSCPKTTKLAASWIPKCMCLIVAPIFDRREPYPLAVLSIVPPKHAAEVLPAGQGTLYDPRKSKWSRAAHLSLPPPVVDPSTAAQEQQQQHQQPAEEPGVGGLKLRKDSCSVQ